MTTLATRLSTLPAVPIVSESTERYLEADLAPRTREAYAADMKAFSAWCVDRSYSTVPATAATVADYISAMADDGYAPPTIARRLAAISDAHESSGYGDQNPVRSSGVRKTHRGIRRTLQHRPRKAAALRSADLRAYFGTLGGDLRSVQVRVILAWGLAGAFRRSELVALNVEDLEETPEGYRATVWRSKTDQEGHGQVKAIAYGKHPETCPVLLMRAWLSASGITEGPVFRAVWSGGQVNGERLNPVTVSRIVKRAAEALGKNPAEFSGHSLRRGFVSEAAHAGAGLHEIAQQTGHKSMSVLETYIEDETVFEGNAVHRLDL